MFVVADHYPVVHVVVADYWWGPFEFIEVKELIFPIVPYKDDCRIERPCDHQFLSTHFELGIVIDKVAIGHEGLNLQGESLFDKGDFLILDGFEALVLGGDPGL